MTSNLSSLATELHARLPNKTFPVYTGKPTFSQVRQIEKLVEQNAGSIKSTVQGAGAFNHIFLTKTNDEWTTLTGLPPVVMPVNPEEPEIANNATAARIAQANQVYGRQKKLYEKTEAMKELLTNQIVSAFEPEYISALRHPITRQVDHQSIPEIFTILYRYGNVQSQAVRDAEAEILATPINLEFPLIVMFDKLEDFQALAVAADEPRTAKQMVNLGIHMLKQTGNCFRNAIIAWDDRPAAERTWANLKLHFDEAHRKLQNASGLPLGQSTLQQQDVNLITEQVEQAINLTVQQRLNSMEDTISHALQMSQQPPQSVDTTASSLTTATAPSEETPTTKLKSFFETKINNMQEENRKQIDELKNQLKKRKRDERSSERNRNPGRRGKEYREGNATRYNIKKYC